MAARGLLCKNLFPPGLVSCLRYQLFLPQKAISKEKHSFKPLCWNVNENCDVDVAINHAGYQSKKLQGKTTLQVVFVLLLCESHLQVFMVLVFYHFSYAANDNSEKKKERNSIRVELRALLISRPPSRMRKGRSFEVEILICT